MPDTDANASPLLDVELRDLPLERFDAVLDEAGVQRLHRAMAMARPTFGGRAVWNVNSTRHGGGVAELLESLLPYARGAGVEARWIVFRGNDGFFRLTKRLHNRLHNAAGDGGSLGDEERALYEAAIAPAAAALAARVRPGDVVLLHDPQTAGFAPALKAAGIDVVWRCHIGVDEPGELARTAWDFLAPYVTGTDMCVFSRPAFAWDVIPEERRAFISPSIDPFAPKNADHDDETVSAILEASGLRAGAPGGARAAFTRLDGTPGMVRRRAVVDEDQPLGPDDEIVVQVSRWDELKDPIGVVDGFVRQVAPHTSAHLVYAGPAVEAVADDPEGAQVLDRVVAHRNALPADVRARVHLARLPMDDPDENAAIVNALQRSAAVVVQKSLAEGFGLTVAEAMWKGRPVVASALGGIQDQIEHERTGILLPDPRDSAAFGAAVRRLLDDREGAEAMGRAARERVRHHFLSDRSLVDYLALLAPIVARRTAALAESGQSIS